MIPLESHTTTSLNRVTEFLVHILASQHPCDGSTGGARPTDDDTGIRHGASGHFAGIDQSGQQHDSCAVLVIVKNRNTQILQLVLYLETLRSGDVLQINAAENRSDDFDSIDNASRILGIKTDGPGIDVGELLEQERLPLHNRNRCETTYVAQSENGRPVGDDGDRVVLDGQVASPVWVGGDHLTWPGTPGV